MNIKAEEVKAVAPYVVAVLLILVCFVLMLCKQDGALKNILMTIVGYCFGHAAGRRTEDRT